MRIIFFTVILFLFVPLLRAETLVLDFKQGSSQLTIEDKEKLYQYFKQCDSDNIWRVKIHSNTSPEGSHYLNDTLSFARSRSVKDFLKSEFLLPDSVFECSSSRVDWQRFERLLWLYDVPYKSELTEIVSRRDIQELKESQGYAYLYKFIYPQLRSCSVEIENKAVVTSYRSITYYYEPSCEQVPLFAIKTNLLFDLATIINLEVEVPLGRRISIEGEFIFPWWSSQTADFTFELRSFHLGLNYWLGDRSAREVLTGWNVGLFGGYGLYDFQIYTPNGIQGRFFDVSIGAAYAHKIARSLRLEYKLGVGFLQSKYEKYEDIKQTSYGNIKVVDYPWQKHTLNWVGVTRARVSLVWMINTLRK